MNFKDKLKRYKAIVRANKLIVDKETQQLSILKNNKKKLHDSISIKQKEYLEGIDMLNQLRSDPDRKGLLLYEECIDNVKVEWTDLFKKVQINEKKLQAQLQNLITAKKKLKAAEEAEKRQFAQYEKYVEDKFQITAEEFVQNKYIRESE